MFKSPVFLAFFVSLILVGSHAKSNDVPRPMVIRFDGKAVCSMIFWASGEIDDPDLLWGMALAQASSRPITFSKNFDYKKFLDKDTGIRRIILSDKGHAGSAITGLRAQIDEAGAIFCHEIAIQYRKNYGRLGRTGWFLNLTDKFIEKGWNRFVPRDAIKSISEIRGDERNSILGIVEDGVAPPQTNANDDATPTVLKVYISQGRRLILVGELAISDDLSNDQVWAKLIEKLRAYPRTEPFDLASVTLLH